MDALVIAALRAEQAQLRGHRLIGGPVRPQAYRWTGAATGLPQPVYGRKLGATAASQERPGAL